MKSQIRCRFEQAFCLPFILFLFASASFISKSGAQCTVSNFSGGFALNVRTSSGQSFQAPCSNSLLSVTFDGYPSVSKPNLVEVRSGNGPTGALLYSNSAPVWAGYTHTLTSSVLLTGGQTYTVLFIRTGAADGCGHYHNYENPLPSGTMWSYSGVYGSGNWSADATADLVCNFVIGSPCTSPSFSTCPSNQTVSTSPATCNAVVSYTATASGSPAPTLSYTFSGATTGSGSGTGSGSTFNKGMTTVTITAANSCGSPTCTFTVTVVDNTGPDVQCYVGGLGRTANSNCQHIVEDMSWLFSASDNCGTPTKSQVPAVGTPIGVGTTVVTLRATDSNNNSAACTMYIFVNDGTAPSITCPAPVTQGNTANQCGANVTFANATAMDNCTASPTITNLGATSGSFFAVGTTSVTFRATDAANNSATCSFNVTVNDSQVPAITCPANISQANTTGQCGANVTFPNASAMDNCTASPTIANLGAASGSFFAVGTTSVTFRATDAANNSATCSFTVTVNDTQVPAITCPTNISQANTTGQCGANVIFNSATAMDNCSASPTIANLGAASGSFFAVGTTSVTFRATDAANNSATCSFNVTVNDSQVPSITCPANTTISAIADCSGTLGSYSAVSVSDNCGTPTVIQSPAAGEITLSGHGTTLFVSLTATDNADNTESCTFTVTLQDVTSPTITCPSNITQGNATGQCGANVTFPNATAMDNCTASPTITNLGVASGSFFPVGTTSVTFRATDAANNSATCSFIVTVNDTEVPSITCPANTTIFTDTGCSGTLGSYSAASVSDNCGTPTVIQSPAAATVLNGHNSTQLVRLTATDNANNTQSCTFTVTLKDVNPPTITCPSNITQGNTTGQCGENVTFSNATAMDNCSASPTITNLGVASGSFFAVGSSTSVTFRATDAANNSATCSFTVTVNDTQAPTISCPANITQGSSADQCGANVAFDNATARDNCGASPTILNLGTASGSFFAVGSSTSVTFLATDATGNLATCSFTVTVVDATKPTIVCPADQNRPATDACSGTVGSWAPVSLTDNCSQALSFVQIPDASTVLSGHNEQQLVKLLAIDAGGNKAYCYFTVTLKDETLPVATCKNATVNLSANGSATIQPALVNNASTDNCSLILGVAPSTFTCSNAGANIVTLTATDAAGNTKTCTATVTVNDNIAPTPQCINKKVVLSASGTVVVQTAPLASGSSDNCSVTSYSPVSKLYNTTNLGVNNLSITVRDGSNNSATCISKVTVLPYGSNLLVSPNDAETGSNALENLMDGTKLDLSLFPNPTSGASTVQFRLAEAQPFHLRLFDLNGRLVIDTNFDGYAGENSVVLEMGSLQAGIYMVEVQSAGMWGRKKLILQY